MRKEFLILLTLLNFNSYITSQVSDINPPYSKIMNIDFSLVHLIETKSFNLNQIIIEDSIDELKGKLPRFGYKNVVSVDLISNGSWIVNEEDKKICLTRVKSKNAKFINLYFDKYHLEKGTKLFIYSMNTNQVLGEFNHNHNKGTIENPRGLGTGIVFDDDIIIELSVPKENKNVSVLNLNNIVHGYRFFKQPKKYTNTNQRGYGNSGSCQVDVNCEEGLNWQDEKRSVALILVDGERLGTGALVNNTCNNGDLFFLTANHNLGSHEANNNPILDNFSFVWNYENENCNSNLYEPDLLITNGAEIVANSTITDFALLKLTGNPHLHTPPIDVFYSGWNRTNTQPIGGVGIHHPMGDVKKISTYDISPIFNSICATNGIAPSNFWGVKWASTVNGFSVQEPGSSGSPLYNNNHQLIGQLKGPHACTLESCDSPYDQEVVYGRFSVSWNWWSNQIDELKYWLDPCNLNPNEWQGGYYTNCSNNEIVVNNTISNTRIFQSADVLVSKATLTNTSDVTFWANNEIRLENGFDTKLGSVLLAEIKSCTPGFRSLYNESKIQEGSYSIQNSTFIYPNPVKDLLSINVNQKIQDKITAKIYNIYGASVLDFECASKIDNGFFTISSNVKSLASGMYFIELITNENVFYKSSFYKQ